MEKEKERINYTQFIIIMIISFAIYLSNQMVQNTVTKFASSMSATAQMIGLIGGTFGIIALITRPFAGQAVDKGRHKPLLFVCVALLVLSNVVLIFATSSTFILISRTVNGLAWGFGSTLCLTTACNSLPKSKLAGGIGIFALSQTMAQVIGPSIALEILKKYSYNQLYIVTTVIMIIAFFLITLFRTNHEPNKDIKYSFKINNMFAVKAFMPAGLLMCNTMEVSAIAAFLLILADERGITGLGFFFTLQALSIIVTRPFVSKFINDRNAYIFTIVSEVMIIAGLLLVFFANSIIIFAISAIFFGIGKSGAQPALQSMCVSSVPDGERGKASNTSYAGQDLGQFIGSYVAGIAASMWGYSYAFVSVAVIVTVGTAIFVIFYMVPNMRKNKN